jgi:hypothetical protein
MGFSVGLTLNSENIHKIMMSLKTNQQKANTKAMQF